MPDLDAGEGGTFTQDQVDELVKEALAKAKGEQDEAFKNLWDEAKDAKAALKKYADVDPEKYRELLEQAESRELAEAEAAKNWEKAKEQLLARQKTERDKLKAEADGLKGQLEKVLRNNAALTELQAADAYVDIMLDQVVKRVRMQPDGDGGLEAVATGLDGVEKSIGELVAEMKDSDKFRVGFKPSGATGGGATGHSGGGAAGIRTRADLRTDAERAGYISEHGMDSYLALPTE